MTKLNDIERIVYGEDLWDECAALSNIGTVMEPLILQLFELFERTDAWCDDRKLQSDNYGDYGWTSNFDLLRIHIVTQRRESVDALIES